MVINQVVRQASHHTSVNAIPRGSYRKHRVIILYNNVDTIFVIQF